MKYHHENFLTLLKKRNNLQQTVLHKCLSNNKTEVFQILLKKGFRPKIKAID